MDILFRTKLADGRRVEVAAEGTIAPGDTWLEFGYQPEPTTIHSLHLDVRLCEGQPVSNLTQQDWEELETEAVERLMEAYGAGKRDLG